MSNFEGRVALVTGAGSGMGRATAFAFGRRGATVVVSDINDEQGAETVALLAAENIVARYVHADVSDEPEVSALVDQILDEFGRLDFAHNNAGVTDTPCSTGDLSMERWHRTIAVDLTGVFICLKHELRAMIPAGTGVIVNTASGAGINGVAGLPAYVAAKHGVIGLTKTAAIEYATAGIRVNAVCPGWIATPLILEHLKGDEEALQGILSTFPAQRLGRPEEVAASVAFLCSDEAAYITGVALPVDGGAVAD